MDPRVESIVASASLLKDNGMGVYAVPSDFFSRGTKGTKLKTIDYFSQFGLAVTAAFHLSPSLERNFSPYRYQIVVQKKPQDSIFIAELGRESESYPNIIANYRGHKKGKIPAMGAWVRPQEFVSFPSYAETEKIRKYGQQTDQPAVSLAHLGGILPKNQKSEYGNSDFISVPRHPGSPVELRSDIPEDRRIGTILFDYNPAKVTGQYLVNYLNSENGRRLRYALAAGSTLPQLRPQDLLRGVVVVPELAVQRRISGITNRINQLSGYLESLHLSLWDDPDKLNEIEHTVDNLLEHDNLDRWIETLPFPIASVLYKYYAHIDTEKRFDYLLEFYEVLAAFQAILLLSGLCSKSTCIADVLEKEGIDKRGTLRNASFGTWVTILKRLRKNVKDKINSNDEGTAEYYRSLYGNPPPEFFKMLLDDRFDSIYSPAIDIRNDWKGHGGDVSVPKYRELLRELEEQLPVVRGIINGNFRKSMLVLPLYGTLSKGVVTNTVKVLAGRGATFRQIQIETVDPMDDQYVHLYHTSQNNPIRLLPFLQMLPTPSTERDACYFYNRIVSRGKNKGKIRLVSYHFAEKSEEFIESDEIKKYVEILKA